MKRCAIILPLLLLCGVSLGALPTTNLIANWRADTGVTTTGAGVSQWDDQSGNGHHLVQATDGDRPVATPLSGLDTVFFDEKWMTIPVGLSTDLRDFTICVACQSRKDTSEVFVQLGSSPYGAYGLKSLTLEAYIDGGSPSSDIAPGEDIESVFYVGSATETRFYHGIESEAFAASSVGTALGGFVGKWSGSAGYEAEDWHVYEIAIYSSALSAGEVEAVSDYFASAYRSLVIDEPTYTLFQGDSLTFGFGLDDPGAENWTMQFARLCDTQPKATNISASGRTIESMASNTTAFDGLMVDNVAYTNRVAVLIGGINDISNSRSTAQVTADLDTWMANAAAKGAITIGCTIQPKSGLSAPKETVRQEVNTYIRNTLVADLKVDLAAVAELSDASNTTYYSDGTHPTEAGAGIMADAIFAVIEAAGYVSGQGVAVPDLVGLTEAAADTALTDVGLISGTVTEQYSAIITVGLVIIQDPEAAAEVDLGSAVDYVVSLGPDPTGNLIINGGFDSEYNWTLGDGWSIDGGLLSWSFDLGAPASVAPVEAIALVEGDEYRLQFTATNVTIGVGGDNFTISLGGSVVATITENVVFNAVVICGSSPELDIVISGTQVSAGTTAKFNDLALFLSSDEGGYRGRYGSSGYRSYRGRYR